MRGDVSSFKFSVSSLEISLNLKLESRDTKHETFSLET